MDTTVDYDSGFLKRRTNDAVVREVWFWEGERLFRVHVHAESHESQSHARLEMMGHDGWTIVASGRPGDFGMDGVLTSESFDLYMVKARSMARVAAEGAGR